MDPIPAQELAAPTSQREPTDAEIRAAKDVLAQLEAEAAALGPTAAAAQVHLAMGRVFIDQLGDAKSAAICYQNAFLLNPQYRPNLEAARRLFASAGRHDRTLALHQREEALLDQDAERAESLRAQANVLRDLGRPDEARKLLEVALRLSPDHPALLKASAGAAQRDGDRALASQLLIRSAGATRDPVYKAQLLRRAVLLLDEAHSQGAPPQGDGAAPSSADLAALHEEAVRKLYQADPNDPVGFFATLRRARAANDWEAVLRLCRQRADRTAAAADRVQVAAIAAYRLGRVSEGLAEAAAALEENRRDGALLALRCDLAEQQKSPDLADLLRQRAEGSIEPSERAHLKIRAALLLPDPMEQEQLLSEALADNPGDAAAIALHARLMTQRDPRPAAERFVALGESLESHSAEEAAGHYLEAAVWHERAANRAEAAALARRALKLVPRHAAALRMLTRTLPSIGAGAELASILEQTSGQLPRAVGAELLARAAAVMSEIDPGRSVNLARRAAEMARGLLSPRFLETWCAFAFKTGDFLQLSQALEARADSTSGSDAADLLIEASELARAAGNDVRSTTLLRKARGVDRASKAARNALLALPGLPARERAELLLEEARETTAQRAAALQAERALVLEELGLVDEAVQACAQSLALAGVDLAVLRRLFRLQVRRGDHAAALAVLVQIAEVIPPGHARAEAFGRAAELAEWRVGDPMRAVDLYQAASREHPQAAFAWAQLARLLAWTDRPAEAAEAYEHLAAAAQSLSERNEARRWAASLFAHRARQPEKAVALLRALLAEAPGDLEAAAELLALIGQDRSATARKERAELRGRLASRCQDPRVAALLRAESAEDRLAAGERDQGIAEYRRALALNPQDRVALDVVEEVLRGSGQRSVLADHLAFRSAFATGETRAALALEQAEIFLEQGRMEEAAAAYRQALASDPKCLIALKGARHLAELRGDKEEVARLLATEAGVASDVAAMVDSALLAVDMGHDEDAVDRLTSILESDPANTEAPAKLRAVLGGGGAGPLAAIYERIGHAHADAKKGALAWIEAGRIELRELADAPAAFFAAGRALARDPQNLEALELRAEAGEAAGRVRDAADALQKRLDLGRSDPRAAAWKDRLGRLYAEMGDAGRALPLLDPGLKRVEPELLIKLASGATTLPAPDAVRVYRRLLEVFPAPAEPGPTQAQLAGWSEALGRRLLGEGQPQAALQAFRLALQHEPGNVAALRHVAELGGASEGVEAQMALFEVRPSPEPIHALYRMFTAQDRPDAAFCSAAVLVAVQAANPEERTRYEQTASRPPPVDLPQVADHAALLASSDAGTARELLAAAMPEIARAFATDMGGGRGALVKGDNPVRRVVAAIARALSMPEVQLHLSRAEPGIVAPIAAEIPGLLVGSEVPKLWSPRQQRFLYARALAHIRRGTHAIAGLPPAQLAALVGEVVRLTAPLGTDLSTMPPSDPTLAERLAPHFGQEAREALSWLSARVAAEPPIDWDALALGVRESAERVALAICGDPAAAISIVCAETGGGLEKPEVARLARFAVSEAHRAIRAR
jgi:tetratricopeptide (TPR) repeat protein